MRNMSRHCEERFCDEAISRHNRDCFVKNTRNDGIPVFASEMINETYSRLLSASRTRLQSQLVASATPAFRLTKIFISTAKRRSKTMSPCGACCINGMAPWGWERKSPQPRPIIGSMHVAGGFVIPALFGSTIQFESTPLRKPSRSISLLNRSKNLRSPISKIHFP